MTSTHSWLLQMSWVFISVLMISVGQTVVCGFGFPLLISYIGRLIFMLRCVGSVIPYTVSMGFEAAHLFFTFLGLIFSKNGVVWVNVLFSLLFCAVVCSIYFIDDRFYLYVVVDDTDEDEEDVGEP